MITVKNIVLHELVRNESDEFQLHLNQFLLGDAASAELLVMQLHSTFGNKTGKGYGFFAESPSGVDVARFALDHLIRNDTSFLSITTKLAEQLHREFVKYPFAAAGVLVFAEYSCLGANYFFVGLVPKVATITTSESLEITPSDYLDISKMAIAARFDVDDMMDVKVGEEARYVSFMRTGNKRRMNDFFIDFLGIELAVETKYQNTVLVQAIEDFLSDSNAGDDNRSMLERAAFAYCDGQIKLKEDISIKELSDTVSEGFDQSFADYVKEQGYELDDELPGDRGPLRRLVKLAGAGGGVSVSIDAQLLNTRVLYDIKTDTLTIKGVPPVLRDQLSRKAKQGK